MRARVASESALDRNAPTMRALSSRSMLRLAATLLAACASSRPWGHPFRTDRLPWLRPGMPIAAVVRELEAEPNGREALAPGALFLIWSYTEVGASAKSE